MGCVFVPDEHRNEGSTEVNIGNIAGLEEICELSGCILVQK